MGDEMKMADMTYSVNCPITGTILDDSYSFSRDYLARYLILIYRIISISRNSQKDMMSHKYKKRVAEFDELMATFLQFAEAKQMDVVLDVANFVASAVDTVGFRDQNIAKETLKKLQKHP